MSEMQFPAKNEDRLTPQSEAERKAKESLQRCVENGVRGAMVSAMREVGKTRKAFPAKEKDNAPGEENPPLRPEVLNNAEGLYKVLDANNIAIRERHRLEEALCGRELTRQERRELKKIREEERMRDNMVIFRTPLAEITAVAVRASKYKKKHVDDTPPLRWAIGFAICMPEDKGRPRQDRKKTGYRKARRRALELLETTDGYAPILYPHFESPPDERVTPHLWKAARALIMRACDESELPWSVLGLGEYHGDEANSRICNLFYEDGFASQFWDRYVGANEE